MSAAPAPSAAQAAISATGTSSSGSMALSPAAQKALSAKIMEYPDHRLLDEPLLLSGEVVKGFGRGSKELGIPTANLPVEALGNALDEIPAGVYYGWASVGDTDTQPCKMVMSIGWNPFYGNKHKTVEPHLLRHFPEDFYGQELRLAAVGYLRPEWNFDSLEALIDAILSDVHAAHNHLDEGAAASSKELPFLQPGSSSTGGAAAEATAAAASALAASE